MILTNQEAIELVIHGFITIDGTCWYRRKGLKTRDECKEAMKKGEMIAETKTAVFLLTESQADAEPVKPALVLLSTSAPSVVGEELFQFAKRRMDKQYQF